MDVDVLVLVLAFVLSCSVSLLAGYVANLYEEHKTKTFWIVLLLICIPIFFVVKNFLVYAFGEDALLSSVSGFAAYIVIYYLYELPMSPKKIINLLKSGRL